MKQGGAAETVGTPLGPDPIVAWLQSDGMRFRDTPPFVDAFARELLRIDIDVWRVTTGIPILHPQIDSASCLWEKGKPVSERRFVNDPEKLRNSPMGVVYAGGTVRRRLDTEPCDFPILVDLRAQGVTEYLALPLRFSDGSWKGATFSTRRPGGFGEEHVLSLLNLAPTLAMILEIQTVRRTMLTLLDTYVGPVAGKRVLEGAIKRGMHETIRAVIWATDLRGFTELSEQLPSDELVMLLNDYFGAMTDALGQHGGEVLKFIGDALLAIFPLFGGSREGALTAARALAAAQEAETAIRKLNEQRAQSGRPSIRFGLALHVGDVLYGNIGGASRLDFTVIGQAVNVASRIEGLCKTLGRNVLLSGEFAALCGYAAEPVGIFELKGVGSAQPIYAPGGEGPATAPRR